MIPKNLLIIADDFGLDPRISLGILTAVEAGVINAFSVMPFKDEYQTKILKKIITEFPEIKIGAHLSLLSPHMQKILQSKTAKVEIRYEENPSHFRQWAIQYFLGRISNASIYPEWKFQIEFVQNFLGPDKTINHLNSHQHLHVLPGLWSVIKKLQNEFKIAELRVPYEGVLHNLNVKFPFGAMLQLVSLLRKEKDSREFFGFNSSTAYTFSVNQKFLKSVKQYPQKKFELMVHPAIGLEGEKFDTGLNPKQFNEIFELKKTMEFFGFIQPR